LLLPSPPPPPPAFAAPVVGWLLRCCPPSAFVIARCHATIDALVTSRFCRQLSSIAATAAAATAAGLPPPQSPPPLSYSPLSIAKERQQQQHHQHTNGSTNVKTLTSPYNLDLFNLCTVFEVCDDGRGNLAISKLLALKKMYLFCDLHTLK
jgi:hypothetical protein